LKPNIVYRIVHFIARSFFKLYGQWELVDYHKMPYMGPVIAAPNHISFLDPLMAGAAITRECAFMARHDLWDNKLIAWFMPRLGAFPVNRGKPDRGAIRHSLAALEDGLCLVMFPEGGRSREGTLQLAEPGVALIVLKSGAPVVPMAVIGSHEMLPVGASKLQRTPLKVVFGDPITFAPDAPRDEILRTIMRAIAALLSAHGVPTVASEDRETLGSETCDAAETPAESSA